MGQSELKLKTLVGILRRLSLPELFSAQDLLDQIVKEKFANMQSEYIKTIELYGELQKSLQESSDESARLEKECSYLYGRLQHYCGLNKSMRKRFLANQ